MDGEPLHDSDQGVVFLGEIAKLGVELFLLRSHDEPFPRQASLKRAHTSSVDTFNLFTGETDLGPDGSEPSGYLCRTAKLGPKLGASLLGMSVYDLPPGEAICPYHFEWTDEEWLIVVSGRPTLRTPEGERVLDSGDVVCFPAGPAGAHSVSNATQERVRVAIVSTKNEFGIAEYPDSDKVGVWAGDAHYMLRRSDHLDYWDGER